MAARDGITGHLDQYHPTFHDAWKGLKPDRRNAWQTNEGSLEQCAYWLDGLVRLGYVLHDEQLIRKATDRLNLVVDGVNRGETLSSTGRRSLPRTSWHGPIPTWAGPW